VSSSWLGLMELFVGAAVVLGWAVIELVILRRDKRYAAQKEDAATVAGGADTDVQGGGRSGTDESEGVDATMPHRGAAK